MFEAGRALSFEWPHSLQTGWMQHAERRAAEAFICVQPSNMVDRAMRKAVPAQIDSARATA
jgi:hypothetical protein